MNLPPPRQLQVFVAAARLGSVSAAAGEIHLSQPAASMALQRLEEASGGALFDRTPRGLRLNARGRLLLPRAEELLARLEAFGADEADDPVTGVLRLGTSNTVGNYLIGELLGDFVEAFPQVTVQVEVGNTDQMVARVMAQRLDVACVEDSPQRAGLTVTPWRQDNLVVCVGRRHPFATRRRLRARDFAAAHWILREPGSATRRHSERVLATLPAGHVALELGQTEAIKQAVIAGLGIALLPAVAVATACRTGQLVALSTPFLDLQRPMSLLYQRSQHPGAALRAFLQTTTAPRTRRR